MAGPLSRLFYLYAIAGLFWFSNCKSEPAPSTTETVDVTARRDSLNRYIDDHIKLNPETDSGRHAADIWRDAEAIATAAPGDSTSAETLFKAGIYLKSREEYTKAIATWGLIVGYYPESSLAPDALFQQAVTFDNDLKDKENAKRYYDKFLQMYPAHQLATEVKNLQALTDKSDEEIIKSFQKKNK